MTNEELRTELSVAEAKLASIESVCQAQEFSLALHRETERIAQIGHWEWDLELNRLNECSEEYGRILGMTKEEVLSVVNSFETDIELVHPDDREKLSGNSKQCTSKRRFCSGIPGRLTGRRDT